MRQRKASNPHTDKVRNQTPTESVTGNPTEETFNLLNSLPRSNLVNLDIKMNHTLV